MGSQEQRTIRQIERRVLRFVREHDLIPLDGALVLAVSGGPDSLALLRIFARLRTSFGVELFAAYVDHGMRPPADIASERDFVAAEVERAGVRFLAARSAVVGRAAKGLSPEDAARRGRYLALAKVAADVGAHAVATGHTRSDQAETVLIRILRGSGLRGLAAMTPIAGWPVEAGHAKPPVLIRPLLRLSRAETELYCSIAGLNPRRDPENENPRYLRNRIRADVMPMLTALNPRVEEALANLADEARDWREVAERGELPVRAVQAAERTGEVTLDVGRLRALERPNRLAALRSALTAVTAGTPGRRHLLALEQLVRGPRGRSINLPNGVRARREGGDLVLGSGDPAHPPALPREAALVVPGRTEIPGWLIATEVVDDAAGVDRGPWTQCFRVEAARGARVGPRAPGDRIALAGMRGRRRLQDMFVDEGVPRPWRDRWPVIRTDRGVLWVPGLTRPAAWATAGAGAALRIAVRPLDPAVCRWPGL